MGIARYPRQEVSVCTCERLMADITVTVSVTEDSCAAAVHRMEMRSTKKQSSKQYGMNTTNLVVSGESKKYTQ